MDRCAQTVGFTETDRVTTFFLATTDPWFFVTAETPQQAAQATYWLLRPIERCLSASALRWASLMDAGVGG